MAKTKIWYLETHTPLFHPKGKNLGTKIFPDRIQDCQAFYDDECGEIEVIYQGIKTYLGVTAYAQWAPDQREPEIKNEHHTEDKSKRSKAQVATPQSHVFEGRGAGKS